MRKIGIWIAAALLMCCTGCGKNNDSKQGETAAAGYRQISTAEAAAMMEKDDGHLVIDVRRADEYAEGHIPGAINIPNESIGSERPAELPDSGQILLVHCRSGVRSKQAAEKLAAMGYTNVYDFGGILSWKGDLISGSTPFGE